MVNEHKPIVCLSYHFPTNLCLKRANICVFCDFDPAIELRKYQLFRRLYVCGLTDSSPAAPAVRFVFLPDFLPVRPDPGKLLRNAALRRSAHSGEQAAIVENVPGLRRGLGIRLLPPLFGPYRAPFRPPPPSVGWSAAKNGRAACCVQPKSKDVSPTALHLTILDVFSTKSLPAHKRRPAQVPSTLPSADRRFAGQLEILCL